MKSKRKVKKIWINPRFQIRFLAMNMALAGGLCLVFWLAVQRAFENFREMGRSAALPPNHVFYTFIERQQQSLNLTVGIAFCAILVVGAIFNLWFSHRIAGPLYRLKISFEEMKAKKRLAKINFRANDYFQEIPDAFNDLLSQTEKDHKV